VPRIRDFRALESAIAQPKATFGGVDLHPTLSEKAAALCFSLVQGHPQQAHRAGCDGDLS
jgi:death-on-curing protein